MKDDRPAAMDTYQSTYRPNVDDAPGERDCEQRWQLLAPHLPRRGVMVDIGSNLGYFGLRATSECDELAVLSIESDRIIAQRQAALVDDNHADRVLLLQGELTAAACRSWADTCDTVDTTLLLAVLHWFDDPDGALAALSSMSRQVLVELPHPDDVGACGQQHLERWRDPLEWCGQVTGRPAELIGRMARHTSGVDSYVVRIHGPVERTPRLPYWGGPEDADRADYRVRVEPERTRLWVRGHEVTHRDGLNLVNLMKLGALVRPTTDQMAAQFDRALADAAGHHDPLPHNCLWTPDGLAFIDDEPVDALTTAADGRRTLAANLSNWAEGRTVSGDVTIRSPGRLQRLRRSRAGRAIIDRIPVSVRRAARGAVRSLAQRREQRSGRGGG